MTSLLHHQYELNEQIRALTDPAPDRCHDNKSNNVETRDLDDTPGCHGNQDSRCLGDASGCLGNHDSRCLGDTSGCHGNSRCQADILKRVEHLERQVRANAQALEDMKRKLEEKLFRDWHTLYIGSITRYSRSPEVFCCILNVNQEAVNQTKNMLIVIPF